MIMKKSRLTWGFLSHFAAASLLFLFLFAVAGCRMPMFDPGLSRDVAGVEGGGSSAEPNRYMFFRAANTVDTIVLDIESMSFSAGPPSPLQVVDGAAVTRIGSGPRDGQYWIAARTNLTLFFDPETAQFDTGPNLDSNYGPNAQMWTVADGSDRVIVRFGSGTTATNRYDPGIDALEGFSPDATNAGGTIARSHSYRIDSGPQVDNRLIVVGGRTDTMYYDPASDVFSTGPVFMGSSSVAGGSHILRRDDGWLLVLVGGGTTTVELFDATTAAFAATVPTWPVPIGDGAHSFRLSEGPNDGCYLTVAAGGTVDTTVYDPVSDVVNAGPALSGAAGAGSSALYLDSGPHAGSYLIVHGNGTVTTTLLDPDAMTTSPGPDFPVIMSNDIVIPLD